VDELAAWTFGISVVAVVGGTVIGLCYLVGWLLGIPVRWC
jgi:hypothetical protein